MNNKLKMPEQSIEAVLQWLLDDDADSMVESIGTGFSGEEVRRWLIGDESKFSGESVEEDYADHQRDLIDSLNGLCSLLERHLAAPSEMASHQESSQDAVPDDITSDQGVLKKLYCLWELSQYGFDPRERATWVIKKDGKYDYVDWPWSAKPGKETWDGLPPARAVAIAHTHPTKADGPQKKSPKPSTRDDDNGGGDHGTADKIGLPVYAVSDVIWKAVPNDGNPVKVADAGWFEPFKKAKLKCGELTKGEPTSVDKVGTCPSPGVIVPSDGDPIGATLQWSTPNPRGVCRVGEVLYVVDRETGAINQFDLKTRRPGAQIWPGPDSDFRPFVGPTWIPETEELVVAALGRDEWNSKKRRHGTLFAVKLNGTHRVLSDQSRSSVHEKALWGCAGTTMLPSGELVVSGMWSRWVSAVNIRSGEIRPLFNLAKMPRATQTNAKDPSRNPDGLRAHPSGELLICDRTQGQLLAAKAGDTPRVLVCGMRDPISVDVDSGGNALVLSKTDTFVYKVELDMGSVLVPTSCRPIASAESSGRACLALERDGINGVMIAVDSGEDNSLDGLYAT